jgi:hypothetical protein
VGEVAGAPEAVAPSPEAWELRMSETWTSLLSGVVGAIVGGAASLAGTMLVNKRQMATNARMRLYDELLPELETAVDGLINPQLPGDGLAEERILGLLEKVRRVGIIAGRMEQRNSHNLWKLWREHQAELDAEVQVQSTAWEELGPPEAVNADPVPPPPGYKPPPSPYELRLTRIRDQIQLFSILLSAKLG